MKKLYAALLSIIIVLSVFAGCSSGSAPTAENQKAMDAQYAASLDATPAAAPMIEEALAVSGMADTAATAAEAYDGDVLEQPGSMPVPPPDAGGVAGPTVEPQLDSRKIIKNADMSIQTVSFDKGVEYIEKSAEGFGGYVQNSTVEGHDMYNERGARSAYFSIRIPSERLDSFINSFSGESFNVTSKSQYSEDITEQYYDSRARLDALKIQEVRLIAMLESAAELEYLLQVEKELMNVRYEIESLTSSLNRMDNSVRLSTVNINLREVVKYDTVENVPVTFNERIAQAFLFSLESFSEFAQGFVVSIVALLPFLILTGIIICVVIILIRRGRKKRAAKIIESKNPQQAPPAPAEIHANDNKDE